MKNLLNFTLILISFFIHAQNDLETCNNEKLFNNDQYIGCLNDQGNPEGFGKMTYENQDVYEGEWINGIRDGNGVFTYLNGYVYKGSWKNNMKSGRGVFVKTEDGQTYTSDGVFENNIIIEGKKVVSFEGMEIYDEIISYKSYLGTINNEINLMLGPSIEFEVIKSLALGTEVFIISDKTINNHYHVIDMSTNTEGYVDMKYINLGEELVINDIDDEFLNASGKSESLTMSRLDVLNNSDTTMLLKTAGSKWLFVPYGKWRINIAPGIYKVIISMEGSAKPYIVRVEIISGLNYKKEFVLLPEGGGDPIGNKKQLSKNFWK